MNTYAKGRGVFSGVTIAHVPFITHLPFIDDILIFFDGEDQYLVII